MTVASAPSAPARSSRSGGWLNLLSVATSAAMIAIGIAALAWPGATVHVIGLLFGLSLVATGALRAVSSLVMDEVTASYRMLGAVFGVLTAIAGLILMRNVLGSAVLLALLVGIGWLLDGVVTIVSGVAATAVPGRAGFILSGVMSVLAAAVVLVWPELSLKTFVFVGAVALIAVAVFRIAVAVSMARSRRHQAR